MKKTMLMLGVFVFSLIVLGCEVVSEIQAQDKIVRDFVEGFCQAEFSGNSQIRLDVVKYSKKRYLAEKKRDPNFAGKALYWDNDPLFVVASYKFLGVKVNKDKKNAQATIAYKRLARTEGDGQLKRKLIPDSMEQDIVIFHLIYEDSRWWIFDPPPPRISLPAIVQYYKSTLEIMGSNWLERPEISEAQKQYYQILQRDLKILEGLNSNLSKAN
jgi:hypothetical protein